MAQVQEVRPAAVQAILLDLPGLLFFSTYTLLVLFWAEIYHQARSLPLGMLRPVFLGFNVLVYVVQVRQHFASASLSCPETSVWTGLPSLFWSFYKIYLGTLISSIFQDASQPCSLLLDVAASTGILETQFASTCLAVLECSKAMQCALKVVCRHAIA